MINDDDRCKNDVVEGRAISQRAQKKVEEEDENGAAATTAAEQQHPS